MSYCCWSSSGVFSFFARTKSQKSIMVCTVFTYPLALGRWRKWGNLSSDLSHLFVLCEDFSFPLLSSHLFLLLGSLSEHFMGREYIIIQDEDDWLLFYWSKMDGNGCCFDVSEV